MKNILIIMMILFLVTGCGCNNKQTEKKEEPVDEIKLNTNEDVIKDQTLEVFTFTNTSLTHQGHTSLLITEVTNTSSETQYLDEFKIHVWDKDGNEIIELTGFIGSSIGANESKTISSSCGQDLTEATSITYEIVR